MNHPTNLFRLSAGALLCGGAFFFLILATHAQAGNATWNLDSTNSQWGIATNWTPATVPNGASDTATFGISNNTNVLLDVPIEVNGIVYPAGASSFTITEVASLTLSGVGITNQSGAMQSFVVGIGGTITFNGSASASGGTFTTSAATTLNGLSGKVTFNDNASAGDATLVNSQADTSLFNHPSIDFLGSSTAANSTIISNGSSASGFGGSVGFAAAKGGNAIISNKGGVGNTQGGSFLAFYTGADAENATITNEAGTANGAGGGQLLISNSTTGNAVIVNEGATVSGAYGGFTSFVSGGSAGNSTIIAKNGMPGDQYFSGGVRFNYDALGENARIEVFGNGFVDITNFNGSLTENTFGSIEGTGKITLGNRNLTVGLNDLNTTFAGVISGGIPHGGNRYGHLTKVGTGKLTLTNGNTYFGGTTLRRGTLQVNNTTGSGLGTGPVQTGGGVLGGTGIIAAQVTIGTGGSTQAVLRPGLNATSPGTLTITDRLRLNADATYRVLLNSNTPAAGTVIAAGVEINGAQIAFQDAGSVALPPATTFTVISNTGSDAVSGTFVNLPDGSTITVGSNTFQANYEGADGNDLTLTVVQ